MKRLLSVLLVSLCMIGTEKAYAQTTLTPLQFNDELVGLTEKLYAYGQDWGRAFNAAYSSKDWSLLKAPREKIEMFIGESLVKLRKMKDVNGSLALRMQMIAFMEFEKKQALETFRPFEKLTAASTPEQIKAAYDKLISTGEAEELAKVNTAQEAYASANGFSIRKAGEEDTDLDD